MKEYEQIGLQQTVKNVTFMGVKDSKAYIKVSTMSFPSRKWSDEVIFVPLSELDPAVVVKLNGMVVK